MEPITKQPIKVAEIEGGRIHSTLESCIEKYGGKDNIAERSLEPDGTEKLIASYFTPGYRLDCFFINKRLESIIYSKMSETALNNPELSYEEIKAIAYKHKVKGDWYKLTEYGDNPYLFENREDGLIGRYYTPDDKSLFKNWHLQISTKDGAISFFDFVKSQREAKQKELTDKL